jgi:uncharacterized damage-inducible protein DinB
VQCSNSETNLARFGASERRCAASALRWLLRQLANVASQTSQNHASTKEIEMKWKCGMAVLCVFILVAGVSSSAAAPEAPAARGAFLDSFQKHWNTAKELAMAVADAMPAESYDFKPVPAEMSFGEQIIHIAEANYFYCAYITDAKSPYPEPQKDAKIEKAGAIKDLGASFDYCGKIFDGLDETKLSQMHTSGKRNSSTIETMMGAMVHMAHHRGQTEVYLRLKGITPPPYKW